VKKHSTRSAPITALRPARPEDVTLIVELIRGLAEFERLADQVHVDPVRLHEHLFGARPYAECVLAWVGSEPAGFALFFHNYSTFAGRPGLYLEDLFVRPEFRGQGHGEALLRFLARTAIERGCGRLEWSVLDWNQRAIDFYRKLGAVPMDEWTVFRVSGDALERLGAGP
jgi:GNAT superfamily N-acetyltransferase